MTETAMSANNRYSRLIRLVCGIFWLTSHAPAQKSVPDMLERVLPSVMTVAVNEAGATKNVFGAVRKSTMNAAYERVLDLSGAKGTGSGFVIERNGRKYIVTNAHVIDTAMGADGIVAYSIDRTRYRMELAGADSLYDLALLQFADGPPGKEVRTAVLREGEPRIGEAVYAVGNPLGRYPYTVTNGIVSGKNRTFHDLTGKFGYLQSSAVTIWGNSGGPLLDDQGRVVGINSRIEISERQQTIVHPQLNFALQSPLASRIITQLLANHGRLIRAHLGVEVRQNMSEAGNGPDGFPEIAAVLPGGPAEATLSGKLGYRIDRVDRTEIRSIDDVLAAFEQVRPGANVSLTLSDENGKAETLSIKAGSLDEDSLGWVAKSLLQSRVSLEARMRNGSVVIRRSSAAAEDRSGSNMRLVQLRRGPDGIRPAAASSPGQELELVAIGLIGDEGALLYRVSDLSSAGAAVKLISMSGRMDLLCMAEGGTDPIAVRIRFSDDPSVLSRTLFY